MTFNFAWKGKVRQQLTNRSWQVSDRIRTKWITWLDRAPDAVVIIDPCERTVELKMTSSVDGVPYCAGLYVRVENFETLLNQIQSD